MLRPSLDRLGWRNGATECPSAECRMPSASAEARRHRAKRTRPGGVGGVGGCDEVARLVVFVSRSPACWF